MSYIPWIKIEHTLPDKPEVIRIAAALRIDQDAVAGKLLRLWIWADQNTVDGHGLPITRAFIDRLTNSRKFASAMEAAGWLEGQDGTLTFPGFHRHNGETAKARAETNRRVAKHRQQPGKSNADPVTDVTEKPLQKPLPEEEVEKEPLKPPLPPQAGEPSHSSQDSLLQKINTLRRDWHGPLDANEHRRFTRNRSVLQGIEDAFWPILARYYAARLPEGDPSYRPPTRSAFLKSPNDVLTHCRGWHAKQNPPRSAPAISPSTPPPTTEPRPIIPRSQTDFLKV